MRIPTRIKKLAPAFGIATTLALGGCASMDSITPSGARIGGFQSPIFSNTYVRDEMDKPTVQANQINAVASQRDPNVRCVGLEARQIAASGQNPILTTRQELDAARARGNGQQPVTPAAALKLNGCN